MKFVTLARLAPGLFGAIALSWPSAHAQSATSVAPGYFRFPAIHGDTVVFTAEGDLWRVSATGGTAQRLTTHSGNEVNAALSPDGKWIAFSGQYEGPAEVYVMPITGGLPKRLTFESESASVRGWTPDGKVLYATNHYSTLPSSQLIAIDPQSGARTFIPLAEADEGVYSDDGKTLFFTRNAFQGSHAKRYAGGTAQILWRYDVGAATASQFHPDYKGSSHWPMFWRGRVYFAGERDGTSNVWSMLPDGSDLKQHTKHADFGIKRPMQQGGRIVYQNGADLWLYDIKANTDTKLAITLASDFDQLRDTWVTKPSDYITDYNFSPEGDRVTFVARGQVFVAPVGQGRLAEVTRQSNVRYRSSSFLDKGKSLLVLSDESSEVEFWRVPANGVGAREQITKGGEVLRVSGLASPDGKWIASAERNQELVVFNVATGEKRPVAKARTNDFDGANLAWSPDSRWLAYTLTAASGNTQIQLFNVESGNSTAVTSDRVISDDATFSPDGKWLYFASDRSYFSPMSAPWGPRQPEPYLEKSTKLYALALGVETRSPFQPSDELVDTEKKPDDKKPDAEKKSDADKKVDKPKTEIVLDGIITRLWEVPVPAGNYSQLRVTDKAIFALDHEPLTPTSTAVTQRLVSIEIKNKDIETVAVATGISGYRLSADGKKLLIEQKDEFYVVDAATKAATLDAKAKVNLANLKFAYSPRESWRQMFVDAWRLHRDYYYDKKMHGVDWKANLAKHLPLVERVTDRNELNDLLNYLVSELSSLHTDARGGDFRKIDPEITIASLGARWTRDDSAGGYRLDHIYQGDPDFPEKLGPLLKPGVGVKRGDIITEINGTPALSVPDASALLRNQAGRQVLLKIKPASGGDAFSRIVVPVASSENSNLRYDDWEYSRRLAVDEKSKNTIGYAHIRAMGTANYYEFVRNYYAAADKGGLILDLRHNRGGNIDSWLMSRLMRPAWMWWAPRNGVPHANFQNSFRGHLVVLVNAWTASDGETMANGVRQLGLGKTIGTRTWGGGIWLRGGINALADRGFARAAEMGSFIPGQGWVIEGDGFTPDVIVDNNPVATFRGEDAQLDAAINYLKEKIAKEPKHLLPEVPAHPDRSLKR
ncbi:S41 family peptidase [Oleiharenicola lentus]|uniref:S41 family peptidase n=1 Tax=Oleiharenicola lentus TaxID=2508720 RepID=UPI003F66C338